MGPESSETQAETASPNPLINSTPNTPSTNLVEAHVYNAQTASALPVITKDHLICIYLNADNILNKRNELDAVIDIHQPDVICITETAPKHCNTAMSTSELQIEGYDICVNENPKRGVAIFTACHLTATPYEYETTDKCEEHCWTTLTLKGNDRMLIGCIYRSPNSNVTNNKALERMLPDICHKREFSHILICGDFNFPDINWTNATVISSTESIGANFLECARDCFLWQHVMQPTHRRGGQTANTLDLIFTNEPDMIDDIQHNAPLGKSHHDMLTFKMRCYTELQPRQREVFNYKRGNYDMLRRLFAEHDLNSIRTLPVQEAWDRLMNAVQTSANRSIPKSKPDGLGKKRPMWFGDKVVDKIKAKNKAYQRYRASSSLNDYRTYSRIRNQARWESRKAKMTFEKSLARNAKQNPKAIFKYINGKLKTRGDITELETDRGRVTSDGDKANVLNNFFSSVFTQENEDIPTCTRVSEEMRVPDFEITTADVEAKLKKLKVDKAAGPDSLHPRVLKELSSVISRPLADLMQNSLERECVPQDWRDAHVCAIHKKGKKTSPSNYRPVSLTSQVCKIMESIVRDHLLKYLVQYNLISKCQHGFVPGRSCTTQLLECMDEWTEALDEGESLDVAYLDFSKAFDSVPHNRLIHKMRALGIEGHVLEWCRSFLSNRKQRVVIRGSRSAWANVLSGVPQGSVVGPLMFVIYINDMPGAVEGCLKMFADDAKLFRRVNNAKDWEMQQRDLQSLGLWSKKWQMNFNPSKCQVLHVGSRNQEFGYKIDENRVEAATEVRDLGVLMDAKLKLHQHTQQQVNKANRILGLLRRTFDYLDKKTLTWLLKALVRPHLEYANTVTYPRYVSQMTLIENVQRRATKQLAELRDQPYEERLRTLALPSMRYRQRRGDMIEMYKFTHDIYSVSHRLIVFSNTTTRGHSKKVEKPRCQTSLRQKIFPIRCIDDWNKLPEHVVLATSINDFKTKLDAHWIELRYIYQ